MKYLRTLAAISLTAALASCATPVERAVSTLTDAQASGQLHGAGFVWITGTEPVWIAAADGTVDASTRFRAGSLTKVLTQLAVLRLVDQGVLELDQTLAAARRGFRAEWAESVTLRQLLAFSAGLPAELSNDPLDGVRFDVAGRALAFMDCRSEPGPTTAPGERMLYSNLSYMHLGAVVEAATGLSYADAVAQLVLRPVQMLGTGFGGQADGREGRAAGYVRSEANTLELVSDHPIDQRYSSGGLFTTARDLQLLSAAIIEPGFLSEPSLRELFTQFGRVGAEDSTYFEASGHVPGFANSWIVSRSPGFAVLSLNNVVGGDPKAAVTLTRTAARALGAPLPERERYRATAGDGWVLIQSMEEVPAAPFSTAMSRLISALQSDDSTASYHALISLFGRSESDLAEDDREDYRATTGNHLGIFRKYGPFRPYAWRDEGERLVIFMEGATGDFAVHLGFRKHDPDSTRVSGLALGTYGFTPSPR